VRRSSRNYVVSILAALLLAMGLATAAGAASGGNSNKGDVWVDNVGQPPGPGHEMDPHLACQDINLWGDKLADPSGVYNIDGWPPSGSGAGDQAWPGTAANPGNAGWSYDQGTGGSQVIAVINVAQLIANAVANGDAPNNSQGFHFKLQFSQDPQKHKTFWVNCHPAPPPSVDCDGDQDSSNCTPGQDCDEAPQAGTAACVNQPPPTGGGGNTGGGQGAGGSVLAASTSVPGLPKAGVSPTASGFPGLIVGLWALLMGVGCVLWFRRSPTTS
jgi:hypothetical protein